MLTKTMITMHIGILIERRLYCICTFDKVTANAKD